MSRRSYRHSKPRRIVRARIKENLRSLIKWNRKKKLEAGHAPITASVSTFSKIIAVSLQDVFLKSSKES